ncbi:MAG: helix-turn-helix transcriptional regulator [Schwartzia sp.]|nr:helix-turn-helix transcriptional regulator [Schwartzia sp. (in: firmicutes)]
MEEQSVYSLFGQRLAALRKEKGLSQAELAKHLGMPQTTYSGYEAGNRRVTLEFIIRLARFFSVSPTLLVMGEEFVSQDSMRLEELAMIKKYRALGRRGKEAVDRILEGGAKAVVLLLDEPEDAEGNTRER